MNLEIVEKNGKRFVKGIPGKKLLQSVDDAADVIGFCLGNHGSALAPCGIPPSTSSRWPHARPATYCRNLETTGSERPPCCSATLRLCTCNRGSYHSSSLKIEPPPLPRPQGRGANLWEGAGTPRAPSALACCTCLQGSVFILCCPDEVGVGHF